MRMHLLAILFAPRLWFLSTRHPSVLAFGAGQYLAVALLLALFAPTIQAAYCSLRDPVTAIRLLYPESNRYRSLVQAISTRDRDKISAQLPFTLHFNEIGQHTLFLVLDDKEAMGFVHARSELSERGIIELAWAINPDLSIKGVIFQRCRSPRCTDQLAATLSSDLEGMSSAELRALLTTDASQLTPIVAQRYQQDATLVLSAVRSALKTLAVTKISWAEDIASIHRDTMARTNLGTTTGLEIHKIATRSPSSAISTTLKSANRSMINPESVQVHLVLDHGRELGRLVGAHWRQGGFSGDVLWLFSPDGTVIDIQSARNWQSSEIASAFDDLIGQQFNNERNCSSATEMVGKELFSAGFRERVANDSR